MSELLKRWPNPKSISIVCGTGNNAGDGYLLAGALQARGTPVEILQVGEKARLSPGAAQAFAAISKLGLVAESSEKLAGSIVVDALLGTGVRGEIRPDFAQAIQLINSVERPVVALDVPSGVDPDTGKFLIDEPVNADLTTCFVGRKLTLLTGRARNVAGEVVASDLDIPAEAYASVAGTRVLPSSEAERRLPPRPLSSHKGQFGHVLILGGNRGMGGAALLTGEACLRTGAGLVSVATHADHAGNLVARRPELMVVGSHDGNFDKTLIDRADVIALGPGLGQDEWARTVFELVCAYEKPLVLDADALNLLAELKNPLPPGAIVTPHPGEAARLLGMTNADVENDRVGAVKELTKRTGSVGVLKGAGTLVAKAGDLHGLCDIAEPALSTAGSGDVLTGVIAAAYAQVRDPLRAAALGVWLHASAGVRARQEAAGRSVIAGDLIDALRPWA